MTSAQAYAENGFVLADRLMPVEACNAFLRQLQDDLARAGKPIEGLRQTGPLLRREAIELYAFHYPPMATLLWGLTPAVSASMGVDLLPSYAYFRIYREGDICRVHSDRYACEHSASLTLDYSDGVPWPLEIAHQRCNPENRVEEDFGTDMFSAVEMNPGDALLYQGVHHRHGRVTPNPNAWSAHLFLHWVERGGRYAEHAFDQKPERAKPINLDLA